MWILLQLAVVIGITAALMRPGLRARAGAALGLTAAAALVGAIAGLWSAPRTLEVSTEAPAYVGNEISSKSFLIETASAPAWAFWLLIAAFCAGWALLLRRYQPVAGVHPTGRLHPFWAPMLFAVSAVLTTLALEKLAAPAGLVQPFPIDRVLLPASAAAAFMLAGRCRSILLTLSWLTLFVTMTRLPVAAFATLATWNEWGTHLDVHSIIFFASPLTQRTVTIEQPGSTEQLGWLVWAPQLLVLPALTMLMASGVALARIIWLRGLEEANRAPVAPDAAPATDSPSSP